MVLLHVFKLVTFYNKIKGEFTSFVQGALDRDITLQLLDYFLRDTQSQAEAHALLVLYSMKLSKHFEYHDLVLLA